MAKLVPCRTCGQQVASAAKACPHCGIGWPGAKRPHKALIILFAVCALVVGCVAAIVDRQQNRPLALASVCDVVERFRHEYQAADAQKANQVALSLIHRKRAEALGALLLKQGHEVVGWTGQLQYLVTDRDYDGHIKIDLPCQASLVSQAIDPESKAYEAMKSLVADKSVTVTGRIETAGQTLMETSLTERGSIEHPDFWVELKQIVQDSTL